MDWPTHIRRAIEALGEDVTYTPSAGAPKTVRGIFLGPYQTIDLGQGAFATQQTEFVAMTEDFPTPARNDSIVHPTGAYKVREVNLDIVGGYCRLVVGS